MKFTQATVSELIGNADCRLFVPFYQRPYVWTPIEASKLYFDFESLVLSDTFRETKTDKFLATVVFQKVDSDSGSSTEYFGTQKKKPMLEIVDGQQRILTLSLLRAILISYIRNDMSGIEDLLQTVQDRDLILQPQDSADLLAALQYLLKHYKNLYDLDPESKVVIDVQKSNLWSVAVEFCKLIRQTISIYNFRESLPEILKCVDRAIVGKIVLDQSDDAQVVFESLNATGLRLSGSDHVRNLVIGSFPLNRREEIYYTYWQPLLELSKNCSVGIDEFLKGWIRTEYSRTANDKNLYRVFREDTRISSKMSESDIIARLNSLMDWSRNYASLKSGEYPPEVKAALSRFEILDLDEAEQFCLMLLRRFGSEQITNLEVLHSLQVVESYAVRQLAAGISPESVSSAIQQVTSKAWIIKRKYSVPMEQAVGAMLITNVGPSKFKTNDEFDSKIFSGARMSRTSILYIMKGIEEKLSRKDHDFIDISVTPIVPLTPTPEWIEYFKSIGWDYNDYISKYGRTLVNWCLVENSLSIDSTNWDTLRKSLKKSEFTTTRGAVRGDNLSEESVVKRLTAFRKACLAVWPMPVIDLSILAQMGGNAEGTPVCDLTDVTGWKPSVVYIFGNVFKSDIVKSWKLAVALMLRGLSIEYLKNHTISELLYNSEFEYNNQRIFSSSPFPKNNVILDDTRGLNAQINGSPNKQLAMISKLINLMGFDRNCISVKIK